MKRTVEYILTICGALAGLFLLLAGITLSVVENKQSYLDGLYNKWSESDYDLLLELMENINVDWILPGIVSVVLGIVLIYCLKKDRYVFVMAWISIAVPGILTFLSTFASLSAIFFIITGLIILVRNIAHEVEGTST